MKYKSALIMLICCIGLFIGSIYEICNKNKKFKNKEICTLEFTLFVFFLIYLTIWFGFAAYSYYTGLYEKLVSVTFMPFWIIGLYMYVRAAYKKTPSINVTKGKLLFVILISCFFIYITLSDFYQAVYLAYIKHWIGLH